MYHEHIFITAVYDVEEPFSRIIISQERVGKASQLEKVYVPNGPLEVLKQNSKYLQHKFLRNINSEKSKYCFF